VVGGDAGSLPRHPRIGARAQGGPVKPADERLAHLTKEAWRAFTRGLQEKLAANGVTFGHWQFLRVLWETDGITQRALSEQAGVMEPTTAAALKSMEAAGYIRRRQVPENRKNVYVHLTPKGRALRARLEPLAQDVNRLAVKGLPAREVEAARRTLLAIIANLRNNPAK
jgi:DNA-binding MarR family transcriptional regulator